MQGVRFYRDASGVPWSEGVATAHSSGGFDPAILGDPRRTPRIDLTAIFSLSKQEAREVQAELVAVIEKWRPRMTGQAGRPFKLSLYFYPDEP